MIFGREPALILGLIQAVIAVAVGFGLNVSPEQVGLIMALSAAVAAVIVRQNVYTSETVQKMQVDLANKLAPPEPVDAETAEG